MICSGCGRRPLRVPDGADRRCPDCGESLTSDDDAARMTRTTPAESAPAAAGAEATATVAPHLPPPAAAPAPSGHAEGTAFGRYLLREPLGSGAMGVVWRAWDPVLDRPVALKQLRQSRSPAPDDLARFLREARLAAGLNHPGIVRVLDAGSIDGCPYLALEYVEGETCETMFARSREAKRGGSADALPRLRVEVERLAEIAEAVAHAHAAGVLHRDLKPSNVLLDRSGRARVADFGLARHADAETASAEGRITRSGQIVGTPAYMSPEQADGDQTSLGPATDVWSLGVMLYEVLTGRLPFEDARGWETFYAVLHEDPAPPRECYRHAPAELEAVCRKAMEKDPARRYADAAEFAAELRRWLAGEPVRTGTGSPWRRRRPARAVAAILALLVAVAGIGAYAWRHRVAGDLQHGTLLAGIARAVDDFEQLIRRTDLPAEARVELAAQPLGLLGKLLETTPDSGPAHAWRGRVFALLGRSAEARADLDRGCALAPDEPVVWLLRGEHRIEEYVRGRPLPSWNIGPRGSQTESSPPDPPPLARLRAGGLEDLETARHTALARNEPESDRILTGRAAAALYSGRPGGYEEAADLLKDAAHPRAWRWRGIALHYLRKQDEAQACLDRALAEWPGDVDARLYRANVMVQRAILMGYRKQDPRPLYAEAIDEYSEALRRDPDRFTIVPTRAVAFTLLAFEEDGRGGDPCGILARSLREMDAVIAAQPGYASRLKTTRASLLENLGRFQRTRGIDGRPAFRRAIADLEDALRSHPTDAMARGNLGLARLSLAKADMEGGGDPDFVLEQAIRDLTEAVRLDPRDSPSLRNRAVARSYQAERAPSRGADPGPFWRQAREDCREFQHLEPRHPWGWYMAGVLRVREANAIGKAAEDWRPLMETAVGELGEAAARGQRDARGLIGRVLEALHRPEEAAQAYELAAANEPEQAEAYRRRAALLRRPSVLAEEDAQAALTRGEVETALRLFLAEAAALGPAPTDAAAAETHRRRASYLHYNLACCEARLAARAGTADPAPHRDRAFAHLDDAVRAGWRDRAHTESDPDLDALHADPRWPTLLDSLRARVEPPTPR